MHCINCPKMTMPVMLPDIACGTKCGKLVRFNLAYCDSCSKSLKKCKECGVKLDKSNTKK